MNLKTKYADTIKREVAFVFGTTGNVPKIYLFGSRARGDNRPYSDVDIALSSDKRIEFSQLLQVMGRLDETTLPYKFDVLDVERAEPAMKANILNEGVLI
jgi:uncharacterized protein